MKVITGQVFKTMVISGANTLHNYFPEIDALNVFPVPDGDTGTNMSLTFSTGAKEIGNMTTENIFEISKVLSKGLLMGARGNSGVILSQIFRGISQGLDGKEQADAVEFADALVKGAEVAYKAVMRPVEGTILTVIREAAAKAKEYAKPEMDIEDLFSHFAKEAEISLDNTPNLLPVLKEVGVVDSGGAGLCMIISGFVAGLAGETVDRVESTGTVEMAASSMDAGEIGFGYCTEFIIRLDPKKQKKFKEDNLKNELARMGDSIVVVQDDDIVKVHVHTLKPGEALNLGQRFGEFVKLKIENMQEQHTNLQEGQMVTSSTLEAAMSTTKEHSKYGVISVAAGDGVAQMFKDLRADIVVSGGQTMNPSTEDIVQACRDANADHVIILPNNGNIVMTAQQAAIILEGEIDVTVIPSKTIPQGLTALINFNPDTDKEANVSNMEDGVKSVKTGQITFAIKDTNIDGVEIKANDYICLVEKEIVACIPNKVEATIRALTDLIDEDSEIVTLIAGEDVTDEELNAVEAYFEDNFDCEMEVTKGMQPVYSFIIGVE